MGILAENFLITMKHPCVDTDDRALWKVDTGYSFSTRRDMAFKNETDGRVNTKGFVDDCRAVCSVRQQ